MKEISYDKFTELLISQDCYFVNTFEDAAIRSELTADDIVYYVKFKGEDEFKAKEGSNIVAGGILEHTIITKEEYESY